MQVFESFPKVARIAKLLHLIKFTLRLDKLGLFGKIFQIKLII